jgi:hypothetical protein
MIGGFIPSCKYDRPRAAATAILTRVAQFKGAFKSAGNKRTTGTLEPVPMRNTAKDFNETHFLVLESLQKTRPLRTVPTVNLFTKIHTLLRSWSYFNFCQLLTRPGHLGSCFRLDQGWQHVSNPCSRGTGTIAASHRALMSALLTRLVSARPRKAPET